ncbi:MAG: DegT/DnrJ/EryC1/StrS family aminotransferase [Dehalococcoidia bacterium]|nr:DegT/DnrJ/EryC1/StrS family aminotransferase [Dehalococcoidia bacterium]
MRFSTQEERAAVTERKAFLPYHVPSIGEDEIKEVADTLRSGWITTGEKTHRFESEFARYTGAGYAVALNSCTAAMHLALVAAGVGEGDEIITTPYTFAATAAVAIWLKAKPVFVDIDGRSFNINCDLIEAAITKKTRAIMPVHIGGHPCDMDSIMKISSQHNLTVIEDAAHALASEYKGKMIGSIGDMTAFSFYATKNITTGEGGMLTTDNEEFASRVRKLSLHGLSKDAWKRYGASGSWYYEIEEPGFKDNLSDIMASLGIHQLKRLDEFQAIRQKYAGIYNREFSGLDAVGIPHVDGDVTHNWHLYIIQLKLERLLIDRAEFIEALRQMNIGASVHFIPLHMHPYYARTFGYKPDDFPNAKYVYERAVSLPLYPAMTEDDVADVVKSVKYIADKYAR